MNSGAEIKTIGEVCQTRSGGTPSRANSAYYGGRIPWVKCGDLQDGVITKTDECITEEGLANSSAKMLPKGTLLIALYAGATIGRLGILGVEACTNQAVCAITPPKEIDTKYLFWYLMSVRRQLQDQGAGGVQLNINQIILRQTKIPMLPLKEQKRIVARVDSQFARLSSVSASAQNIKEKLRQVRTTIWNHFTENARDKIALRDFADVLRPRVHPAKFPNLQYVGLEHVESHSTKLTGAIPASQMKSTTFHFQPGDILYGRMRPYLNKVICPDFEGLCSSEFIVLTPKDGNSGEYLKWMLNSPVFVSFAISLCTGDRPRVQYRQIKDYPIPYVSPAKQAKIAEKISNSMARLDKIDGIARRVEWNIGRTRKGNLGRIFATGEHNGR